MWTDEALSRLRTLVDQGLSGGEIARILGISRNSVIGKIHREKSRGSHILLARAQAQGKKRTKERRKRWRQEGWLERQSQLRTVSRGARMVAQRAQRMARLQSSVVKFRPVRPIVEPSLDIVFLDRKPWQCSWIVDEKRDGFALCCGHMTWGSTSWCSGHLKVVENQR